MPTRSHAHPRRAALFAVAALLAATAPAETRSTADSYAAFARQNDDAMNRMMAQMVVKPTGDVDVDFVAMMIPHHQGAIDMAQAVLRYGRNDRLHAIARGIVEQQTKEIALMRAAVGGHVPTARPPAAMHGMIMK